MNALMPSYSGSIWIGRFAAHLKGLVPAMNVISAVKHAVATWPYACHLTPEESADIFHVRLLRNEIQLPELIVQHGRSRYSTALEGRYAQ